MLLPLCEECTSTLGTLLTTYTVRVIPTYYFVDRKTEKVVGQRGSISCRYVSAYQHALVCPPPPVLWISVHFFFWDQ